MPNWLDYTILILFPVILAIEARRGFGLALFDLVALLAAIRFVPDMIPETAGVLRFSSIDSVNHAYVYMVLCLTISGVMIIAATTVYNETVKDLSFVHPFFGGVLGIGTWVAASHIILRMLYISSGSELYPSTISQSVLASQCLDFQSLHTLAYNLVTWMLKSSP